jgi:hypothetical protein
VAQIVKATTARCAANAALHPGAQQHLHEVRYVWKHDWLFVRRQNLKKAVRKSGLFIFSYFIFSKPSAMSDPVRAYAHLQAADMIHQWLH